MANTSTSEIPAVRLDDPATRAQVKAYGLTDTGQIREANEDAFAVVDALGLYLVCDGMGGHAAGEVASHMAVDIIVQRMFQTARPGVEQTHAAQRMAEAMVLANDRVHQAAQRSSHFKGMGTTVAAVKIERGRAIVGHIGDSRVYRWNERSGLEQVTRDHSLLNQLLDDGSLLPEEVDNFPYNNIILRAIGIRAEVEPEVQTIACDTGDVFLMCSDGLTDMVYDSVIASIIGQYQHDLDRCAELLVDVANEAGGHDNISVVLARVEDAGASPFHSASTHSELDAVGDLDIDSEDATVIEAIEELEVIELAEAEAIVIEASGDDTEEDLVIELETVAWAEQAKEIEIDEDGQTWVSIEDALGGDWDEDEL